jgi:hypothetical protein
MRKMNRQSAGSAEARIFAKDIEIHKDGAVPAITWKAGRVEEAEARFVSPAFLSVTGKKRR